MAILTRIAYVACLALLVAACGGDSTPSPKDDAASSGTDASNVDSVLMIDGKQMGSDGRPVGDSAAPSKQEAAARMTRTKALDAAREQEWPAPKLNADGTIDDGPDPFLDERIQVQPIPIEDEPESTEAIDAVATQLRRVDRDQWDRWMGANDQSPWQQGVDDFAGSIVELTVERCGGARTVATGVVLAPEIVATTVHAIETSTKRVRVAPAAGAEGPRLAAMVRYLDVDDDIAILKVPGLKLKQMPFHVIRGAAPKFGFAYGTSNVGTSGTLRRVPVVVSMEQRSIELEQPDGFAEHISDRSVHTLVGGVTTGFSGGVVAVTNDPNLSKGWGFHGLVRARVPYRADTGGIVVPGRIVGDALLASGRLDQWFEHRPGGCAQWRR